MSEFRQNFATKEWVIIAPERTKRPSAPGPVDNDSEDLPPWSEDCPFCPGNEHHTETEHYRIGGVENWRVRVIQNKFSALSLDHSTLRTQEGRFIKADSYGVAEVIIEHPAHNVTLAEMTESEVVDVLYAYHHRVTNVGSYPNIAIVLLFRNYGGLAGTSLAHPHSQIIASPIVPPHIRDPFQKAALHYDTYGSCVYCDMVLEELQQGDRIIHESEHFVAFCPFASRSPYEIRIYPKRHAASYAWITEAEIEDFARVLRSTIRAMRTVIDSPSYNYIIRSSPVGDEDVRYLHWYFLLIPKISTPAGFEIGSGIYINHLPPEICAAEFREVFELQS
jgi:UDPglucose--hexose-1-phosphate uridylyltransferase